MGSGFWGYIVGEGSIRQFGGSQNERLVLGLHKTIPG